MAAMRDVSITVQRSSRSSPLRMCALRDFEYFHEVVPANEELNQPEKNSVEDFKASFTQEVERLALALIKYRAFRQESRVVPLIPTSASKQKLSKAALSKHPDEEGEEPKEAEAEEEKKSQAEEEGAGGPDAEEAAAEEDEGLLSKQQDLHMFKKNLAAMPYRSHSVMSLLSAALAHISSGDEVRAHRKEEEVPLQAVKEKRVRIQNEQTTEEVEEENKQFDELEELFGDAFGAVREQHALVEPKNEYLGPKTGVESPFHVIFEEMNQSAHRHHNVSRVDGRRVHD